jgi:sugar lactone lactonase YvrE
LLPTGQHPGGWPIDADYVYWTNTVGGTVARVRKTGGTVAPIASALSAPFGIAVDADGVFVSVRDGIIRIPPAGPPVSSPR